MGPDFVDTDEVAISRRPGSKRGAEPEECRLPDLLAPTSADTTTSTYSQIRRSRIVPDLIRDEEAVGSNPATPTTKLQVKGRHLSDQEPALDHLTLI